jgi:alcohol dehydrogenase class IV
MFTCYLPRVQFGTGILNELGHHVTEYGKRAFLTIDPFLDSKGFSQRIQTLLGKVGISVTTYTDIQPNPDCRKVDEAGRLADASDADMVIAVGGGSALDFGKGVAIIAKNTGKSWDYTERSDHEIKRPQSSLPIIAIPTTAGTGSEATPFAVLNNPEIKEKSTIVSNRVFPSLAIIDPELMVSLPARLTASTGFDAFSHALESYISLRAMPFSKMVAKEAMRMISRYLPEAVANGNNIEAREKMAWSSCLAGAAIAHIGVTLPHALGQPVGGLCNAPHGESVAACTVDILEKSYLADIERFAEIAELIDPSVSPLSSRQKAERSVLLVSQLLRDINLSVRFSDFGMTEADIEKVTNIALTSYYFDICCHPKTFTKEEIQNVYRNCL